MDFSIRVLCNFFRRKKLTAFFLFVFYLICLLLSTNINTFQERHSSKSKLETKVNINWSNSSTDFYSSVSSCDEKNVILSSELDFRPAWKGDQECQHYLISHMIPKCKPPMALASYPGSGNTWVRYLLEAASGIFTGSRYKDLQIQIFGFWGEIRNWKDGTTLVQKTHDASEHHVVQDFGGRAILVVRNPYDAILSTHNFLYAGHHAKAPVKNYEREDWEQFVTIQLSKWVDMVSNWTMHSNPEKVLVLHYENLRLDLITEMENVLQFLGLPVEENRLRCLMKHPGGYFHRKESVKSDLVIPFPRHVRQDIDKVIIEVNQNILKARGYTPMPLESYKYFQKEDVEILKDIEKSNSKLKIKSADENSKDIIEVDRIHGTQMVVKEYLKWLESEEKLKENGKASTPDDGMTFVMKNLLNIIGKPKDQESLTKLSARAEVVLSMAVEWWPRLQRPFSKDPIQDAIESDGFRGSKIKDIKLPI